MTESGGISPLSLENNASIVSSGPVAEELLGKPATVDMLTPRVGAVASESRDAGTSKG